MRALRTSHGSGLSTTRVPPTVFFSTVAHGFATDGAHLHAGVDRAGAFFILGAHPQLLLLRFLFRIVFSYVHIYEKTIAHVAMVSKIFLDFSITMMYTVLMMDGPLRLVFP